MANLSLIRSICAERHESLASLSRKLNFTPAGLSLIMKKNNTDIRTLERISEVLGVHPTVFFAEGEVAVSEIKKDNEEVSKLESEIASLREIIQNQRNIINVQEDLLLKH